MLEDQRLELSDQLAVAATREVGLDPLLERDEPQLLEPRDLRLGERLVRQVAQRGTAPERERPAQLVRRGLRLVGPRLAEQALEAVQIELPGIDAEEVAGRARDEPALAQLLAEPGHVDLDRLRRGGRRATGPQRVDQPVARHGLVRAQQQDREQATLSTAAEREHGLVLEHLERA